MAEKAPSILTKEFCKNNSICFHPETVEEAAFIQEQLFKMGIKWCTGSTKVMYAEELTRATLHINYDIISKGISWSSGGREINGTLCTAEQLGWVVVHPEMRRAREFMTPEFCKGKVLLFYPQTMEESAYIQEKLFALGHVWSGESQAAKVYSREETCRLGMVAVDGKIYLDPSDADIARGVICRAEQLGNDCPKQKLTPEQLTQRSLFNELSARLLKQQADIDALKEEVLPKPIEKPVILSRRDMH